MDDGTKVVKLANPKTLEYQVVRTSLLPGLLKTVRENKAHPLPLKVFETSDVVIKDPDAERQARNIRHAAALWCNKTAGFEVVHGLLDRIMAILEVPRIQTTDSEAQTGYYLKETDGKPSRLHEQCIDLMALSHSFCPPLAVGLQLYSTAIQTPHSSQGVRRRLCIGHFTLLRQTMPQGISN